jgi:hypothetical protein
MLLANLKSLTDGQSSGRCYRLLAYVVEHPIKSCQIRRILAEGYHQEAAFSADNPA